MLPGIQEDFGWSNATAVAVSTAISVGTAIVVFGVGPLVDRLGRRKGMLITVSGTALASAATAATFNPAYLIGVRSIGGLGLAEQGVNTTYLNEIYALSEDETITKRRGFIYSIVQGGWPLGTLLAAAFAAVFLPLVGWRGCFLVATFPALLVILVRRTLKETPQFALQDRVRKLLKDGRTRRRPRHWPPSTAWKLSGRHRCARCSRRSRRNTIFLGLAWFTNWFGIQTFSVLGTSVLVEGKNVDFAGTLVMFIIINLVAFTGYLFHGWAGDRFGRRNVIAVAWLISGVLFAAMLLFASGTVAVVVLYSLGMFFLVGPYSAMLFYMGEAYTADCRATGASLINAIASPGRSSPGSSSPACSRVAWSGPRRPYVGALGTFLSGFVVFACKKVAPLSLDDGGVHEHDVEGRAHAAVQA